MPVASGPFERGNETCAHWNADRRGTARQRLHLELRERWAPHWENTVLLHQFSKYWRLTQPLNGVAVRLRGLQRRWHTLDACRVW